MSILVHKMSEIGKKCALQFSKAADERLKLLILSIKHPQIGLRMTG